MSRLGDALATGGTYGPGLAYIGITVLQSKACGGLRSWAKGGFGATKVDEMEREEREVEQHVRTELDLRAKEDGYNGA